ncbi:hypothetical protein GFS03_04975 [Sulfolobus sp. E5-1-F]|uniref:hypothetical protein n=1 Tax=Saccharolobus sp. E5-1-F TaxID=2663019 RepID=UPI0012972505|nr:hypothetical protein [Sulfolobus sp. E5-1-F]QGA53975.1 hypothetical protein GFS03_04975 [Sulfolobus sp. E5-1-F]
MAIRFYSHEFRLFATGILSFLILHYLKKFYLPLPEIQSLTHYHELLTTLVNLIFYSVIVSLLTYKLFKGNEPGKYYIIWYWSIFINYYFFGVELYFPFNLGIFTGIIVSLLYSIPPTLVMYLIRLKNRNADIVSLSTVQLWFGSVMFSVLILLSFYTKISITPFLYGSVVGLLLSFIAIGTKRNKLNLSLIPMVIIALKYSENSFFQVTPFTLLLVIASSFLIFWVSMKPLVLLDKSTAKVTPIGVVSPIRLSLFFPILIIVIWYTARLLANEYFSPLTLNTFPVIFLPAVADNIIVDYLKGRQLNNINKSLGVEVEGILGGVGLADGLWLDLVGIMIYYLTILRFGFLLGTVIYILIIVPIIGILSRFV